MNPSPVACLYVSWPHHISQHLQVPPGSDPIRPVSALGASSAPAQVSPPSGKLFHSLCFSPELSHP